MKQSLKWGAGLALSLLLVSAPMNGFADDGEDGELNRTAVSSGPYHDLPWLNQFVQPIQTIRGVAKAMEECLGPWVSVFGFEANQKED